MIARGWIGTIIDFYRFIIHCREKLTGWAGVGEELLSSFSNGLVEADIETVNN